MSRRIHSSGLLMVVVAAACLMMSCRPGVPKMYIQPGEMEDILYDYHVAAGMADMDADSARAYNDRLYKLAVLKKHRVSEAAFDTSLVYYMRHADRMHDIYEKLAVRLSDEALALGASAGMADQPVIQTGDTANLWKDSRCIALVPEAPYHVHNFKMFADSSYRKGDRFVLSFDTRFLYQEGVKEAIVMLALRLGNDSVVSRLVHASSNSRYTLEVADQKMLGAKELRGFIFLRKDKAATATTLKLMVADNIRLIRFHLSKEEMEKKAKEQARMDSIKNRIGRDSLPMIPDSLKPEAMPNMPPIPIQKRKEGSLM